MKLIISLLVLLLIMTPLATYAANIEIIKLGSGLGIKTGQDVKKFLYDGCYEAYYTMQKRMEDGGLIKLNDKIIKQILKDASIKPDTFKEYCMHKAGMVTFYMIKNGENIQNITTDESAPKDLRHGISCVLENARTQDFAFMTGYYIYRQMFFALNQGGGKTNSLRFMAEPESDNLPGAVFVSCPNAMSIRNK